jgi:hypothetical protein
MTETENIYTCDTRLIPFDEVLKIGKAYRAHFNIKEWGLAAYMGEHDRGHYVSMRDMETGELTARQAFKGEPTSC